MNVQNNCSAPAFGALYIRPSVYETAVKASQCIHTSKAYNAAEGALKEAAGKMDLIIEAYGDKGAAVWKGDVPRCDIFKKTEHVVSDDDIITAFQKAAKKLKEEADNLAPKKIRQRFPGNKTGKLDKTV